MNLKDINDIKIKDNNLRINNLIQKIVDKMQESNASAIENVNGELKISDIANRILKSELEKILLIYDKEFYYLKDREPYKLDISIRENNELDAWGHAGGMEISSGTSENIKELREELTYSKDKNGRIKFDKNGQKVSEYNGKISKIKDFEGDYLLLENEQLENEVTPLDYITYLALKKSTDLEFFLDAMPHETMHIFGFADEGTAETLTRHCCNKYGIRNCPFAHSEHTKFIQKIQRIVGTRELSIGMYGRKSENARDFLEKVSDKLNIEDEEILYNLNELYSNGQIDKAKDVESNIDKKIRRKTYSKNSEISYEDKEIIEQKARGIVQFQEKEIYELQTILESIKLGNNLINSLKDSVIPPEKIISSQKEKYKLSRENKQLY